MGPSWTEIKMESCISVVPFKTIRAVKNIGHCQGLCEKETSCKSVGYNPGSRWCSLKDVDTSTETLHSCLGYQYSELLKGDYYKYLTASTRGRFGITNPEGKGC